MPKVSVIIPVYGVEKYIERCARSLFEQTLEDIEFIFVNDCSPDNSMAVLSNVISDYPKRVGQIKIVNHDVNKGLPTARRSGLAIATGDYVIHCDSDDWMERDAASVLYSSAMNTNSDLVVFEYYTNSDNKESLGSKQSYFSNKENLLSGLISDTFMCSLWTKFAKKDLYNEEFVYPTEDMGEDGVFCIQLAIKANKPTYCTKPLYHYCQRGLSMCGNSHNTEYIDLRYQKYKVNTDMILKILDNENLSTRFSSEIILRKYSARFWIRQLIWDKKYYNIWKNTYPEITKQLLCSTTIPLKTKISFCISYFKIEPVYRRIYNLLRGK